MAVYDSDLTVQCPVQLDILQALTIRQAPGGHGELWLKGLSETGGAAPGGAVIRVIERHTGETLFCGLITESAVKGSEWEISASSGTVILDFRSKSRSFQDINATYADVVREVLADTPEAAVLFASGEGIPIGRPLYQYKETDWGFILRLAAALRTSITADVQDAAPRLWFGAPAVLNTVELPADYELSFSRRYYELGGAECGYSKEEFLRYRFMSGDFHPIGAFWPSGGLRITEAEAELRSGELRFTYTLAAACPPNMNLLRLERLTGLTLTGTVRRAERESVYVDLDIDEGRDVARYPYPWAPLGGNLFYSMPEKGARVQVVLQEDGDEASSCVIEDRSNLPDDPQMRGYVTAQGKRLELYPGQISLRSGGSGVTLGDNSYIKSAGDITLHAKGNVQITARHVSAKAATSITVLPRISGLLRTIGASIKNEVSIMAGSQLLFYTKRFSYPDFEDAPHRRSGWASALFSALGTVALLVVPMILSGGNHVVVAFCALGVNAVIANMRRNMEYGLGGSIQDSITSIFLGNRVTSDGTVLSTEGRIAGMLSATVAPVLDTVMAVAEKTTMYPLLLTPRIISAGLDVLREKDTEAEMLTYMDDADWMRRNGYLIKDTEIFFAKTQDTVDTSDLTSINASDFAAFRGKLQTGDDKATNFSIDMALRGEMSIYLQNNRLYSPDTVLPDTEYATVSIDIKEYDPSILHPDWVEADSAEEAANNRVHDE
jgi:hypothetical protein